MLGFAVPFHQCEQNYAKILGQNHFCLRQSGIKFFTFFSIPFEFVGSGTEHHWS
jgi:hypothetical protein